MERAADCRYAAVQSSTPAGCSGISVTRPCIDYASFVPACFARGKPSLISPLAFAQRVRRSQNISRKKQTKQKKKTREETLKSSLSFSCIKVVIYNPNAKLESVPVGISTEDKQQR